MPAIAKGLNRDASLFEGIYNEYSWNFDKAIEEMYPRTAVQLSWRRQREICDDGTVGEFPISGRLSEVSDDVQGLQQEYHLAACHIVLQCRNGQIAWLRRTSQELIVTEDRDGRQHFISWFFLFLPIQRLSSDRSCQTAKCRVCPILCTLIIEYAFCDIFMLCQRCFLAFFFAFPIMYESLCQK